MNEIIISILSSAAVSAALTAILIWLTKSWVSERIKGAIQTEYQQKLETHKAQLRAESDATLEHLKNQLQVASAERQVRYSRVFERTAETVATTFQKLLALHKALNRYTVAVEVADLRFSKEACRNVVSDRQKEFADYFYPRCLYLPKETSQRIDDLHTKLLCAMAHVMHSEHSPTNKSCSDQVDLLKLEELIDGEVPKLLTLLEDHFRELLGITDKRQNTPPI